MTVRAGLLILAALALAGCSTMRAYDGPARAREEVAVVTGDLRFTAGAPLSLILRAVDGRPLDARYNAVEVEPGKHVFIVDCVLRETRATSRHEVSAEVDPGTHYGFTAEMAPAMRGCASVELQPK